MKYHNIFSFILVTIVNFNLYTMLPDDLQQKYLYEAIENDDAHKVEELLLVGVDPNKTLSKLIDQNNDNRNSPTHKAIQAKKPHALAALLKHGGTPNTGNIESFYYSNFYTSLTENNAACLDLLLQYKVKTTFSTQKNIISNHKISAFKKAITTNDPEIIKVLIKHNYVTGADITAQILPEKPCEIENFLLSLRKEWAEKELKKIKEAQEKARKDLKRSTPDDEKEDICLLCLDELTKEEINTKKYFSCSHNKLFHTDCIKEWKYAQEECFRDLVCPLCKNISFKKRSDNTFYNYD